MLIKCRKKSTAVNLLKCWCWGWTLLRRWRWWTIWDINGVQVGVQSEAIIVSGFWRVCILNQVLGSVETGIDTYLGIPREGEWAFQFLRCSQVKTKLTRGRKLSCPQWMLFISPPPLQKNILGVNRLSGHILQAAIRAFLLWEWIVRTGVHDFVKWQLVKLLV